MKGLETYLVPWLVSNIAGLLILWAAIKKPRLARALFVLLFGWACWMNYTTVRATPGLYLDYAALSVGPYREFILGWFKDHVTLTVSLIAIGQGLIALGMLLRGWWVTLACIGAIVFLLGIAPLGVGAGFPFSITVSAAAFVIIRKDAKNYLWKFSPVQSGDQYGAV